MKYRKYTQNVLERDQLHLHTNKLVDTHASTLKTFHVLQHVIKQLWS